ncbi:hypothetical protein BB561_006144, partial [Smittium simulii]
MLSFAQNLKKEFKAEKLDSTTSKKNPLEKSSDISISLNNYDNNLISNNLLLLQEGSAPNDSSNLSSSFTNGFFAHTSEREGLGTNWRAMGNQPHRTLVNSSFSNSEDYNFFWSIDDLIDKTDSMHFDQTTGLSHLGGNMAGNNNMVIGGMVSGSVNDKKPYSNNLWNSVSRSVESDTANKKDHSSFKSPNSKIEISGLKNLGGVMSQSLSDSRFENLAEFVDSVLMGALDTDDEEHSQPNISSSIIAKNQNLIYNQSQRRGSFNIKPNTTTKNNNSLEIPDLDPSLSTRNATSNQYTSSALYSKNTISENFSDISFADSYPAPSSTTLEQRDTNSQAYNYSEQMRYRSAMSAMQYYESYFNNPNNIQNSFSQNLSSLNGQNTSIIPGKPGFSGIDKTSVKSDLWSESQSQIIDQFHVNSSNNSHSHINLPYFSNDIQQSYKYQRTQGQNITNAGLTPNSKLALASSYETSIMSMNLSTSSYVNNMCNLNSSHYNNGFTTPAHIINTINSKVNFPINEMGRGISLNSLPADTKVYIVQFKGKRSDLFFFHKSENEPRGTSSKSLSLQPGVCVIVEADRGQDLGLIVEEFHNREQVVAFLLSKIQQYEPKSPVASNGIYSGNITPTTSLKAPSAPLTTEALDDNLDNSVNKNSCIVANSTSISSPQTLNIKDIYIKRIFRLADKFDIDLMVTKAHDEQRALLVCQSKVRQLKLSMEVVDAEYQWDRRKLTFLFIADHRIDFRELVRELFKSYKTRIWMCAVDQNPILGQLQNQIQNL